MNILALNTGSSSLKFGLVQFTEPATHADEGILLASGQIERIGSFEPQLTVSLDAREVPETNQLKAATVFDAIKALLQRLTSQTDRHNELPLINAIGHRIVHGGDKYLIPTIVTDTVANELRELSALAPLHNPSGLAGIDASRLILPSVTNVALFDTAFHHNISPVAARYALPVEITHRLGLRRYGFHGISYKNVSERLQRILNRGAEKRVETSRTVICHLGNGASVCALLNGTSIDTSMGFTPLEGLIMGTRSGDIDAGLLLHLMRTENMTVEQVEVLLNFESGLLGISEISGDVRDLEHAATIGDARAKLALEAFAYRVQKYIGAYAAVLGGIDLLVFTGGIGQHSKKMRSRICQNLGFLGLHIDEDSNQGSTGTEPLLISSDIAQNIWIVPTDEVGQIAFECFEMLQCKT